MRVLRANSIDGTCNSKSEAFHGVTYVLSSSPHTLPHCTCLHHRGFRQATRGPDTGAFSHPLFQKDKPELCHGMVCQRSRDAASPDKATKKQKQLARSTKGETVAAPKTSSKTTATLPSHATTTATRIPATPGLTRLDASPSMTDSSFTTTAAAASVCGPLSTAATAAPLYQIPDGITTNQTLVQAVLQQRDDMERMQAAKAMLYESYMKALHSSQDDS